jgi:hypothetical protein
LDDDLRGGKMEEPEYTGTGDLCMGCIEDCPDTVTYAIGGALFTVGGVTIYIIYCPDHPAIAETTA